MRQRYTAGEIDAGALRAVEDEAIAGIIAYQEDLGLPVVTDGEFRRENWWIDFVRRLEGVEIVEGGGEGHNDRHPHLPRQCPQHLGSLKAPMEGLAECCFAHLNVDRFWLEYDDERSGTFAPLRSCRKTATWSWAW
jgi:hypothetical protein